MRKGILMITLLLCSTAVFAQTSTKFELLDIYNLEYISDPQISPDGKYIVYVRNFKDIMTDRNLSNLWLTFYDRNEHRQLTSGNQNDSQPVWSPNSQSIVYKSNKEGSSQLYRLDVADNVTTKLTNGQQSPGRIVWSPDSRNIAFTQFVPKKAKSLVDMPSKPEGAKWNDPPIFIDGFDYRSDGSGYNKSGQRQIFVMAAAVGTPRQLTFDAYDHGTPAWSSDGKSLYFSANHRDDADFQPLNSEIYQLNISDGSVTPLTTRVGPDRNPQVSADGRNIAYLGFDDQLLGYQHNHLYVMKPDGSNARMIPLKLDRSIDNIQWGDDGKWIYFQYEDQGKIKLARTDLNGNYTVINDQLGGLSLGRPYGAADFSVSNNGRFAFTLASAYHPSDLAIGDSKNTRRATDVNMDVLGHKKLGAVEEIKYKSSYDQTEIQGWIVKPPDFDPSKKYPLILEIHGGPFAMYAPMFTAEIQAYASKGYVVLYTNPRGSSGYGHDFGNLIHHNYPNQDYDDLMTGVDEVIKKGYIDEENLFVTGGSGGGVLTAWIVGKTNRFRAAVVAKPVINWYSFVLYADNLGFFYKYWFAEKPWENPESYLKRSPISYAGNVTTPTMLLTGEEDYRTPIAESEQFYAALKLNKVETAMVRIPNASHGIASKPSNLIAKIAYITGWFEKYKH